MAFDPLTAVFQLGSQVIDRLWPDPVQKAQALLDLQKLQQSGDLAVMAQQAGINQAEAGNASVFVSGWRPFVGWICGAGLLVQFIVGPLIDWASAMSGHAVTVPPLDVGTLTTLLIGMLGLSGMRTVEKLNGAQGNH